MNAANRPMVSKAEPAATPQRPAAQRAQRAGAGGSAGATSPAAPGPAGAAGPGAGRVIGLRSGQLAAFGLTAPTMSTTKTRSSVPLMPACDWPVLP